MTETCSFVFIIICLCYTGYFKFSYYNICSPLWIIFMNNTKTRISIYKSAVHSLSLSTIKDDTCYISSLVRSTLTKSAACNGCESSLTQRQYNVSLDAVFIQFIVSSHSRSALAEATRSLPLIPITDVVGIHVVENLLDLAQNLTVSYKIVTIICL